MKISVACPVCRELVVSEFDGTLHGVIAINDNALLELTAPAEISQHMRSHLTLREDGAGFDQDPRYWVALRQHMEMRRANADVTLRRLDEDGLGYLPEVIS